MPEDFLQYLWKYRLFSGSDLRTTRGEKVTVIHPGMHNEGSGPDFFNARIKIGDTVWAGNVEIHIKASDWNTHRHGDDKAYDNVVLHVVYENDVPVQTGSGRPLACLELRGRIPRSILERYETIRMRSYEIPCAPFIGEVAGFDIRMWLQRLLIERLERKTGELKQVFKHAGNDWEQAFYVALAGGFGMRENKQPMQMLASGLPLNVLKKHRDDLFQIESLLFGRAGMLREPVDGYSEKLAKEFKHLSHKYSIESMDPSLWKYGRLRPPNFPTVRIAQFAALLSHTPSLFDTFVRGLGNDSALSFPAGTYWDNHYVFGKPSVRRKKQAGKAFSDGILINIVAPFRFLYGMVIGNEEHKENAIGLLERLPAEKNRILTNWKMNNIFAENAAESQSLIQLFTEHCKKTDCLHCAIGKKILKNEAI